MTRTLWRTLGAALVPCVVAAGCGSGGHATSAAQNPAAVAVAARQAVAVAASLRRHLRILFPPAGAHMGAAVTVRVRVTGGPLHVARPIRYVLDGAIGRAGTTQLTFRELAPGRHRLLVLLAGNPHVTASSAFTVLAPAPAAQPASAEAMPAQTEAPAAAAPPKAPEPRPPNHTATERPSTEHSSPPPRPAEEGAIPQGGGGDRDGDNSGAPSDGDGNI